MAPFSRFLVGKGLGKLRIFFINIIQKAGTTSHCPRNQINTYLS